MLTNAGIAELLALEADQQEEQRAKACRSASRAAFLWPIEVARMLEQDISLTELPRVGPWIAGLITAWVEAEVPDPEPPPLRSDFLTLGQARSILEHDPQWIGRLRGDLQMHTVYSDGKGTIEEMAAAGIERGYEYVAITDHSQGLKIAGGLDEAELQQQWGEIAAVNGRIEGSGLTVLRSLEMNIDPEGKGDMDPAVLAQLDIVIGSFHSKLRLKDDQTERYIAALDNPTIDILGHPRGRMYNFRIGLPADWPRVFAAAAERGKAVEIDCFTDRQDLNVGLLHMAARAGVYVSLGTDSHRPWQLDFAELGAAALLEAGVAPERIVNFMTLPQLREWVQASRSGDLAASPG